LNGSKREKETLLETETPPTGGAILMFLRPAAACGRRQSAPQPSVVAKKRPVEKKPHPPKIGKVYPPLKKSGHFPKNKAIFP